MLSAGLNELVTPSLIGEPLLKQFDIIYDKDAAVKVEYPASEEFTMLRQTMAASLLNCMKYNYDNGQKVFWGYEFGKVYNVKVTEITDFGAFVEVWPGCEGLIHISQLDTSRVEKVSDVVKVGDEILAVATGYDKKGKLNLSRKELLKEQEARKTNKD